MFAQEELNFILSNTEFYSIPRIILQNIKILNKLPINKENEITEISSENQELSEQLDEIYLIIREKIFNAYEKYKEFKKSSNSLKHKISSTFDIIFIDLMIMNKKLDKNIYDVKKLCDTCNKISTNFDILNKELIILFSITFESTLSATRQINLEILALSQIIKALLSNFDLIRNCHKIYMKNELYEQAILDKNNSEFAIFKCNEAMRLLKDPSSLSNKEEYEYEMSLLGV
jgi:hypothetical protein